MAKTTNFPPYKKVGIDTLIPYARNSRTHSDEQVAQIAASIKEFGFTNPVLIDSEGGIIAGHGRVLAARKLDMDEIPVLVLSHLSDPQRRAYIIADNQLALNAGWNLETLRLELHALDESEFNIDLLGFDGAELSQIMFDPDFDAGSADDQGKLDELSPKIVKCPHCGEQFDSRT